MNIFQIFKITLKLRDININFSLTRLAFCEAVSYKYVPIIDLKYCCFADTDHGYKNISSGRATAALLPLGVSASGARHLGRGGQCGPRPLSQMFRDNLTAAFREFTRNSCFCQVNIDGHEIEKKYFVFPKQRSKSATNRKIFNKILFIFLYPNYLILVLNHQILSRDRLVTESLLIKYLFPRDFHLLRKFVIRGVVKIRQHQKSP